MPDILVIDDDPLICDWISNVVIKVGHHPVCAHSLEDGLERARSAGFDIVFIDVHLPDGNGLEAVPQIRGARLFPEVIVVTGMADPDEAELAIKSGAWDYLEKPASFEAIKLPLLRALEYRAEKRHGVAAVDLRRMGIIGDSPKISASLDLLSQAAQSDANVLISGETGTGKELFAKVVHANSPRARRSFVVVDCTALPETLVESVLFGHARGAFTGAETSEEGLIKQADGGTLFLDEIGELPLSIQKRFLRVVQERRFRPVGGRQEIASDFRLIAATNRDLEAMARDGRFREDLLFRLRTLEIDLPPLRDIPEDIKKLTVHYMDDLCKRFGIIPKQASPEFWQIVVAYPWPGNVRELTQALEKALISAKDEPMLYPKHLPTHIRIHLARRAYAKRSAAPGQRDARPDTAITPPQLKEVRQAAVAEAESRYLKDLLHLVGGDINKACRISGMSRSRFYTILKKYRPADTPWPE